MSALAQDTLDELFSTTDPNPTQTKNKSYWQSMIAKMPVIAPGTPAKDGEGKPIVGSRFVKRIVVHANAIYVPEQPARQVKGTEITSAKQIRASFERKGFDPTESGEGVIVVRIPKTELPRYASLQSKEFELLAGFHRHDAQCELANELGSDGSKWEWFIVDEYAYETPLARLTHAGATNCHWIAKFAATENDIYTIIRRAFDENLLPREEQVITQFVDQIAGHMSAPQRKRLVKTTMATLSVTTANGRLVRSMIPKGIQKSNWTVDPRSVNYWIGKMDLPVNGLQTNSYNDLGSYYSDEGSISKCVTDGIKKWINEGCPVNRKVFAVFYVNTADLAKQQGSFTALRDARRSQWLKAEKALQIQYDAQFYMIKSALQKTDVGSALTDKEIMNAVKRSYPVVLAGFLPQESTPDNQNGGAPSETTLVDVDGNPRDIHQILGRI